MKKLGIGRSLSWFCSRRVSPLGMWRHSVCTDAGAAQRRWFAESDGASQSPQEVGQHLRLLLRRAYASPVVAVRAVMPASNEGEVESSRTITVGSFTSVALDPPIISFAVNRDGRMWQIIKKVSNFEVFLLGARQAAVAERLGGTPTQPTENEQSEESGEAATKIINGAIGSMRCELDAAHQVGERVVIYGRVSSLSMKFSSSGPLLFHRQAFYTTEKSPIANNPAQTKDQRGAT